MLVSEVSILVVGSTFRSEFEQARAVLERAGRVVPAIHVGAAAAALEGGGLAPDLIVVAQAYPGQFSSESIDRLRRLSPVAPVIGLLGSWCEGEMRSGDPWPAATRVYWHQWAARCEQEVARLRRGECTSWALPATAGEEERLLAAATRWTAREGHVLVRSAEFEMHDWLAAACRKRNFTTGWLRPRQSPPARGATAAIFDAGACLDEELDQLDELAAALAPAPVVALLEFPRIDDHERALAAGAAAVCSKPLLIGDLFWQLDRVIDEPVDAAEQ